METIRFDLTKKTNPFKILNATNGGPWLRRNSNDQQRTNFHDYKAARIPYSRNHDSALSSMCGGPYSHDISCIFPDFDADPYAPASYDFDCTDEDILVCLEAGTKTFFRLGQSIEHQIRKHGTIPPKDFKKWAVICEHIIRHYNEGWANGYKFGIEYWEIWNEPDLDPEDAKNKRTWGGTKEQFFDLYEVASKHLKGLFPNLKIGGPALAFREDWAEDFLREMSKRNAPLDFFSWHIYCPSPSWMVEKAERIKEMLIKYGYAEAESILNEWNYIRGWEKDFVYSIKSIISMKGAAFVMACISEAQRISIDMLMYYDTLTCAFNGVFDFYTYEKLKAYYPLYWYGMFYDMAGEIQAENRPDDLYSICGIDKNGKAMAIITYYSENDDAASKKVKIDFGRDGKYEIYLLDKDNDASPLGTYEDLEFDMTLNSCILIKEI